MALASTKLDNNRTKQFDRDGCLFPIKVLEDAEVKKYLDLYFDYVNKNRGRLDALASRDKYKVLSEMHFVYKWVWEIASNPRILDAVEGLLGPNILAWNTNWFSKMPGDKTFISWHQDGTYWNLNPPSVVTAWVALTPSQPDNGGLRVIPGTHTQPKMPQRETINDDNALSRGQEIAIDIGDGNIVEVALMPGEMSLHHIWIAHGSKANTGTVPRIGVAIRYVKPEVVQDSPGRPLALLVRGKDTCGNFELLPPPTNNEPINENVHIDIIERIRASVMTTANRPK